MGKALSIGFRIGLVAALAALTASTARAQETAEFRFTPELPRFREASPLRIERDGGSLRLGGAWQLNVGRDSFHPTDTLRMRYEDAYVEHRLTDRLAFEFGATRFKHREQERVFRDVTYGARFRIAF